VAFLRPEDVKDLDEVFSNLTRTVTLRVAADEEEYHQLIGEVAACGHGKIVVLRDEKTERKPSIALSSETAKGRLAHAGLPVGYEMATLVAAIVDLGAEGPLLGEATLAELANLKNDVHIQVFSTPT
jgi:alkyl hydroperoxide reductase subunit AhpF